jgi:predicted phosphate transport protein (TIGR00153 family)
MRIPFITMFVTSPFDGIQEHAEKVKECAWVFQQAIECFISKECKQFEELRQEIDELETQADGIKRRIRGHLPKGTLLPVDKFQLFRYLREQDKVLDAVKGVLDWISYRSEMGISEDLAKDITLLVDSVLDPIDELSDMVERARTYFRTFSEDARREVKEMIHQLRQHEHDADQLEEALKRKIFGTVQDPVAVYHLVQLADMIGDIADHAENAGDMMRAMIAK